MLVSVTTDASGVQVRELHAEDAAAVARLLRELGYPAEEADVRDRIKAWAGEGRGAALGALSVNQIVGCAAIYVVPFFERSGSRARLVALVVDSRHRERGVGRLLLAQASEFARRRGAVEIEVTTRRTRMDADRFYTRVGFADVSERSRRYIAEL